jgi:hypothetical protein
VNAGCRAQYCGLPSKERRVMGETDEKVEFQVRGDRVRIVHRVG